MSNAVLQRSLGAPKLIATHVFAAALGGCLGLLMFLGSAAAKTTPTHAPVCMAVTDTTIVNFLNKKVPAWLFTNKCTYSISFYVQYPGMSYWVSVENFPARKSLGYISTGQAAKLIHLLECPREWEATGNNSKVCYE